MKRRCTDPLCPDCHPELWEPPEEMAWGWPYLLLLAIFVLFVIVWMVQGGTYRVLAG